MNQSDMSDRITLYESENNEVPFTLELENMNGYQEKEQGYYKAKSSFVVGTAETQDGEKHHETKKWNTLPIVKDKSKDWTLMFNQPLSDNVLQSDHVQVVDEQGESIEVDLTIDGAKLTVTPTSEYEEGIVMTFRIE